MSVGCVTGVDEVAGFGVEGARTVWLDGAGEGAGAGCCGVVVRGVVESGADVVAGIGVCAAACAWAGEMPAEMFITRGSSGVTGCGLLGFAPGDAVDSPSWRPGKVSVFRPLLFAHAANITRAATSFFMPTCVANSVPPRRRAPALGEDEEMFATQLRRRCYAI